MNKGLVLAIVVLVAVLSCIQHVSAQVRPNDVNLEIDEERNDSNPTVHSISLPSVADCYYKILTVPNTLLVLEKNDQGETILEVTNQINFTSKFRQFGVVDFWFFAQCNYNSAYHGLGSEPAKITVTVKNVADDIEIFGWARAMSTSQFAESSNDRYNGALAPVTFIDYDAANNSPATNYSCNWDVRDDFPTGRPYTGVGSWVFANHWAPVFDAPQPTLYWKESIQTSNDTGHLSQVFNRQASSLGYPEFGPFKMGAFGAGQYPDSSYETLPTFPIYRFTNTFTFYANDTSQGGQVQRSGTRNMEVFFTPWGFDFDVPLGFPSRIIVPSYSTNPADPYVLRSKTGLVQTNLFGNFLDIPGLQRGRFNISYGYLPQGNGEVRIAPLFTWGFPEKLLQPTCTVPGNQFDGCPIFFENPPSIIGKFGYLVDAGNPNAACDYSQSHLPHFQVNNGTAAFQHYYKLNSAGGFMQPNPNTTDTAQIQTSSNITLCFTPNPDYFGPVYISYFATQLTNQLTLRNGTVGGQGMFSWWVREARRPPQCVADDSTFLFAGGLPEISHTIYIGGQDPDWKDRSSLLLNLAIPSDTSQNLDIKINDSPVSANMTSSNNSWKVTITPKLGATVESISYVFTYSLTDSAGLQDTNCKVNLTFIAHIEVPVTPVTPVTPVPLSPEEPDTPLSPEEPSPDIDPQTNPSDAPSDSQPSTVPPGSITPNGTVIPVPGSEPTDAASYLFSTTTLLLTIVVVFISTLGIL